MSPDGFVTAHVRAQGEQTSVESLPRVKVLLATYNGAKWLDEQLTSIFDQIGVEVSVIASDDASSDATPQTLAGWSHRADLHVLPAAGARLGSAHRNFLRLIRDASLDDAEYVALADQDDVWLPSKLCRAVEQLRARDAHAFSSDVTAFWPDGRTRLIRKSQPQRSHDHLFGSPGPGCTFVIRREAFDHLRDWVTADFERLQRLWVHDWLIYAHVRQRGLRWHIDDRPLLLYRQHGRNEIGVNSGWRAALSRWRHVRSGAYRRDIVEIASLIGDDSRAIRAIGRLSWSDRIWLVLHARDFRRQGSEALLLALLLMVMQGSRRE
jgi:rhamnosyltransferase